MDRQELRDFFDNQVWMFLGWIISALLAYRTSPETGLPLWISVATGVLYLLCWGLVLRADVGGGKWLSPTMIFMLVVMALACVTLTVQLAGWSNGFFVGLSMLWMVPVGLPVEGLVLLATDTLRTDAGLAAVSIGLLALLLTVRTVWFALTRTGRGKNG